MVGTDAVNPAMRLGDIVAKPRPIRSKDSDGAQIDTAERERDEEPTCPGMSLIVAHWTSINFVYLCLPLYDISQLQSTEVVECIKTGEKGPKMRWDWLFADLEAQASQRERDERGAEVDERARAEAGRLHLVDRLRAGVGSPLRIECAGGLSARGTLERIGSEWLLLSDEGAGELLLALDAVLAVAGLGRLSADPDSGGVVGSRLGLRSALRALVRDRATVRVVSRHGAVFEGTLDRVGADFVELATHPAGELRRRGEVRDVLVLALADVAAVRRM
jgi:hypothetical protein